MSYQRVPPDQRKRRPAPTPDQLARAGALLEDGASQAEVTRTTGIARETLVKHFPGKGWTYKQAGEYRQLLKHTNVKDL